MKIQYSKDADAIYIRLRDNDIVDTDSVTDDVIMDYDADGNIVAIEILSASTKTDMQEMIIREFAKVMVDPPVSA